MSLLHRQSMCLATTANPLFTMFSSSMMGVVVRQVTGE